MFSKIKGFIFDLDDTIVESEKLNVELIRDYFQHVWAINLDEKDKDVVFGHSWKYIYSFLIEKYNLPISVYKVQEAVLERKRNHLKKNTLKTANGIRLVLKIPVKKVIVSGSGTEEIEMILRNVKLYPFFDKFFSADDYEKGKPEPDGFIMAMRYLGFNHDEVLAFEDAKSGIEAAKKEKIPTVYMREFAESGFSNIADYSYDNFREFHRTFMNSFGQLKP